MQELVSIFRCHDDYELEMCLCTKTGARDVATQISEPTAFGILKVLTESAGKGHFNMKSQIFVDYFYDGGSIRHRCFVKSDVHKVAQTIRKRPISRVEAICPERDFAFRFHLKQEQPIVDFDTIAAGQPCFVRVQQEWAFEYKSAFRYSVKKVQAGGTSKQECLQQPVHFEIEIEVLRNEAYLASHDDTQLAESLIQKSLDLCGRFKSNSVVEPITLVFVDTKSHTKKSKNRH